MNTVTFFSAEAPCETRLLADPQHGQAEAFDKLCQALRPRLFNIALRITRNREDAEDAVQDALMSAYRYIEEFRGNSAFSTWLTRITINSAHKINRKNRNIPQASGDDFKGPEDLGFYLQISDRSPNPEQVFVQRERTRILHRAIRKLRPLMRAVVEVAQFHDLPINHTAKVLNISVGAAKSRYLQARRQLRKLLPLSAFARSDYQSRCSRI
jgi:RNA polymerase sigma-70 factor, ECF subfamily